MEPGLLRGRRARMRGVMIDPASRLESVTPTVAVNLQIERGSVLGTPPRYSIALRNARA